MYSQDIVKKVCERLAQGKSLRTICKEEDMPDLSTIFDWLAIKPEFAEQYARAKEAGAEAWADEIMDIADNGTNDWMEAKKKEGTVVLLDREHVERSKLRIESRKWLLSKLKAKKYGEKLDMTTNGKDMLPVPILGGLSKKS